MRKRLRIGKVHETDGATSDLVFVSRSNAALRGADGVRSAGVLSYGIEFTMQRQNQRDVFRNAQIVPRDRNALTAQTLEFVEEGLRIEHHAVADHRQFRGPQHA